MKKIKILSVGLLLFSAVCLAAGIVCSKLSEADGFGTSKTFQEENAAYMCSMGEYGYAVTDFGCMRVLLVDCEGCVTGYIHGSPFDSDGEYIADVVSDEEGNVYVQFVGTDINSYSTLYEAICKYDRNGNYIKEIFYIDYSDAEKVPHRNPQINGMAVYDNILYFALYDQGSLRFLRTDTRNPVCNEYYRDDSEDADFRYARFYFLEGGSCAYIKRTGSVGVISGKGPIQEYRDFDFDIRRGGILPIFVCGSAEALYIGDDHCGSIMKVFPDGTSSVVVDDSILPEISENRIMYLTGKGNELTGVSGGRPFVIRETEEGMTAEYIGDPFYLKKKLYAPHYVQYLLFALSLLGFVIGVYSLITKVFEKRISLFVKQLILIIPAISLMMIVTVNFMYRKTEETIINDITVQATSFCVTTSRYFDGNLIDQLTSIEQIDTQDFKKIHLLQRELLGENRDAWNSNYYNAIYSINGNDLYQMSISNDSYSNFIYSDEIQPGSQEEKNFLHGEPVVKMTSDHEGTWVYVQMPIMTSEGKLTAIYEVGADMANIVVQTEQILKKTLIKALLFLPIVLLSVVAITFFTIMHLKKTGQIVEKIASGDLSVRMKYISRDELGDISSGVNKMAENLSMSFSSIAKLKDCYFKFVPVQFMELLGKDDITEIQLGDARSMDMTIMFFDIRSFSLNSEMMTAEKIFHLVNEVAGKAVPIIKKYDGFVDKYIGDAVMALFTNADQAVQAGIELYHEIVLNPETSVKIGDDNINIGIGIHLGTTMVGIIGQEDRLSSTVISDNVNLCSRLESLTKQYRTGMIISKDTVNRMDEKHIPNMRFLGMIQVAGVHEIKALFEVLDALDDRRRDARLKTKEDFESGIRKYHLGKFQEALDCLERVREADPEDIAVVKYIEVIRTQMESGNTDKNVFRFANK